MYVALHTFLSMLANDGCRLLHWQEFPPGFKEIWTIALLSFQKHGAFGHHLATLYDRTGSRDMPKKLKVIFSKVLEEFLKIKCTYISFALTLHSEKWLLSHLSW